MTKQRTNLYEGGLFNQSNLSVGAPSCAGDRAVKAAKDGNLRMLDVSFAYPLRRDYGGDSLSLFT